MSRFTFDRCAADHSRRRVARVGRARSCQKSCDQLKRSLSRPTRPQITGLRLPTHRQLDQPGLPPDRRCVLQSHSPSRVETVSELLKGVREQVPIAVHRDLDGAVAKVRLDRLGVGALGDQQGRAGVPQIMERTCAGSPDRASAGQKIRW